MVFGLKVGLSRKAPAEAPACAEPPASTDKRIPGHGGGHVGGQIGGLISKGGTPKAGTLTVNEFVARTKKCREKGLEPTKPELIAYARYLGIDPINDGDLMWIADEALNAPLPAEWTEHHDSAERVFYYNVQTHASSWTHPLEQLHRDTYKSIVSFRSGNASKEDQGRELESWRHRCEESEREAHRELQAWTEHTDDQGTKFYFNSELQRSVWTDPRPARCHTLYLQMKALRALSKACGYPYAAREPDASAAEIMRSAKMPTEASRPAKSPARSIAQPNKNPMDAMRSTRNLADPMRSTRTGMDPMRSTKTTDPIQMDPKPVNGGGCLGGTLRDGSALGGTWKASDNKANRQQSVSDTEGLAVAELCDRVSDKEQRRRKKKGRKAAKECGSCLSEPELGAGQGLSDLKQVAAEDVDCLPMIGRGKTRLATPPVMDGLSTVGRARVRAGIKLEPLRAL